MAAILAGVHSRRRTIHHHRLEDPPIYRKPSSFIRDQLDPSTTWATTSMDMDETSLRARRRLEQKLCFFRSSCSTHEGGGRKETRLASKIKERVRPWHFHLNTSKSDSEICAVCLEDFRVEKQVMDLSCSHKYHSECLLPWLAAHPHCPSCRTPVQAF